MRFIHLIAYGNGPPAKSLALHLMRPSTSKPNGPSTAAVGQLRACRASTQLNVIVTILSARQPYPTVPRQPLEKVPLACQCVNPLERFTNAPRHHCPYPEFCSPPPGPSPQPLEEGPSAGGEGTAALLRGVAAGSSVTGLEVAFVDEGGRPAELGFRGATGAVG